MSDRLKPQGDEPKPFPIWKWVAALGGLYFAYSIGYSDGRGSVPADFAYAAQDASVEIPVDAELVEAVAIEAAEEPYATIDSESDATAQVAEVTQTDEDYAALVQRWQSADAGRVAADNAAGAALDAARAAEAAADDAGTAADSYSRSGEQIPTRFASVSNPQPATTYNPQGGCAENGSCYGDMSTTTGRPKTVSVQGYYRRDGTYVRGHYRSR